MADFPASHVWLPEGSFQDIARIIQESIQGLELQPSWLWRREACRLCFYMIFLLSYVIPCDSPPSMDWFVGQTLQENPMIFVGKLMVSCKFAPTNQCIDTLFHHPFQWDFHGFSPYKPSIFYGHRMSPEAQYSHQAHLGSPGCWRSKDHRRRDPPGAAAAPGQTSRPLDVTTKNTAGTLSKDEAETY